MVTMATINSMGKMTLEKLAFMMGSEFKNIDRRFDEVHERVDDLTRHVETGFQSVRGAMTDIKSDIHALKEDMKEVKEDIHIHHAELANLNDRVERLEEGRIRRPFE